MHGAPEGIRTPGLLLRRQTLYPAELRAQTVRSLACFAALAKCGQVASRCRGLVPTRYFPSWSACSCVRIPLSMSHPDGYLLGSYRIATAPRCDSSPAHALQSTRFDSPANNVGHVAASLGCTTNSYSRSITSSRQRRGARRPQEQTLTWFPLELLNGLARRSPRRLSVPIDPLRVLDTDVLLAASIVRAKGSHPIGHPLGLTPVAGHRHAASIIS